MAGATPNEPRWCHDSREFYPHGSLWKRVREHLAGTALHLAGIGDMMRNQLGIKRNLGPGVHFIYLHHVFADEEVKFRALLASLARLGSLVGHSEAIRRIVTNTIDRTLISVSFDDGLVSCVRAARILEEFGTRGCFFICPEVTERSHDHGWIAAWCRQRLHKRPAEVMCWADVEALRRSGHEIGNHTMSHTDVAQLDPTGLADEIGNARETLVRRLGSESGQHFAWPYGEARHMNETALQMIWGCGHTSCASAVRGMHVPSRPGGHPVLLRNHVIFSRPVSATETFMRRNMRLGRFTFHAPGSM